MESDAKRALQERAYVTSERNAPARENETTQKMLDNYGYVGVVYCDYDNFYTENKRVHEQYKEPFCKEKLLNECIIPCHSLVAKYAACGPP